MKQLDIIMQEMCSRVGVDWKKIDATKDDWYSKYTWTEKEQESYAKWLVDYLGSNKDARIELMAFPSLKDKKSLRKVVDMYLLNYGWKCKYNTEDQL